MTEAERYRHPDCIYRNRSDPAKSGNCNYLSMTGRSRTALLPEELRKPCNCPRYVSDGKRRKEPERDWREDAAALYAAGKTDREIAEALGKYVQQVQNWLWNIMHRPPNRPAPGFRSKFDWEKAEELYRHALSDMDISKALGCNRSAVAHWRVKHELLPNTKRRRKANED